MTSSADSFLEHRPLLLSIAYRMLSSVTEAEDLVQEAYLRWHKLPAGHADSPRAFLSAMVTRLAIDYLRSARVRREQYVGPWLPEPLPDTPDYAGRAGWVEMGFLCLMERLTPVERAVFVLRESFDYAYADIAPVVGKSPANCRQLHARARRQVADGRTRFRADAESRTRLIREFLDATMTGRLDALERLLAADVRVMSDGGGKAAAAVNPIDGFQRVSRFFLGLAAKAPAGLRFAMTVLNGGPAFLTYFDGRLQSATFFEDADGRIRNIYIVRNPDKLAHLE